MLGPYPIVSIIEKLAQENSIKRVGGVADLEVARTEPPRTTPAVHVVIEETGSPSGFSEQGAQDMTAVVKLVMWERHAGEADTGAKAAAAMTVLEQTCRAALFGFQPDEHYRPLWIKASGSDTYFGGCLVRQLILVGEYIATP
jgi:hypothetical protein